MTWAERAARVIPGGVNTYSKSRTQLPFNAPDAIERAIGYVLYSTDNRAFIDWTMGLGAVSLGYGATDSAIQVVGSNVYGIASALETEFAEQFVKLLPWPDAMVRFGLHGSDATWAAVRAARHLTGRDQVISQGYHGTAGEYCPNPNGIPKALRELTIEWDGRSTLPEESVACVIVEPDGVFDLAALRRWCDDSGALLVFDEVLTGFRTDGYFHSNGSVTPDFLCAAKAISNGVPLSIVAGPRKWMGEPFSGGIGYSMTHLGNTAGLAAGLETMRQYQGSDVIAKLHETGAILRSAWNGTCSEYGIDLQLTGSDSRLVVKYPSLAHKTVLAEEMFDRGICFTVGFTPCFAHDGLAITRTITAARESIGVLARQWDDPKPRGPVMTLGFRKMVTL